MTGVSQWGKAIIGVTFGGKNTFAAGGRMLIRVTLNTANRAITHIATNW